MAQKFTIEGLAELDEALKELPKATARNVLQRALKKAIEPVAVAARQYAPRRTGKLAQSISFGTRLSARQRSLHKPESDVELFAGASALPHAHLQEFGTRHHAPKPFLRPAWDANKMRALATITDDLADEIEKARQRLARKAERLAAQMRK